MWWFKKKQPKELVDWSENAKGSIEARRDRILDYFKNMPNDLPITRAFVAKQFGVSKDTIKRDIQALINRNNLRLVRQEGNNGSVYKVIVRLESRMKGSKK